MLVAAPAFSYPSVVNAGVPGQLGTGVDVTAYRRVRDQFLDLQYRAQTTRQGNYEAKSDGLDQVELAFAEPGDNGINSLLEKFWDAWQDVANAPENVAARQALVQAARRARRRRSSTLARQLTTIQSQTAVERHRHVGEVNTIGEPDRATSTSRSRTRPRSATRPNDLLDRRDLLLDRLAQLGNVSTTAGATARSTSPSAASTLVAGARRRAATLAESDLHEPLVRQARRARRPPRRAAARLQERSSTRSRARLVAQDERAAPHRLRPERHAGGDFFASAGTTAATIAVDAGDRRVARRRSRPRKAPASTATRRRARDRRPARRQLDRRRLPAARHDDRHRLAGGAALARQRAVLADALSSRRDSVSGVSLDEEMTNLLRFQRGFQASSRALNAMDEMLDMLVNRTGRVGL